MHARTTYLAASIVLLQFVAVVLLTSAALAQDRPLVPPPPYAVNVTPDNVVTVNRAYNTNGYSETFWVTNIGSSNDTYAISCSGNFNVTCTGTDKTTVPLAAGTATTVVAYYNVSGTGLGRLTLHASGSFGEPSAEDDGYFVVPVVIPNYQVAVAPDGGSQWATIPPGLQQSSTFTVENRGNIGTLTYALTISSCTAPLSSGCTSDSASITIPQGEMRTVAARFNVQNTLGVGTLGLRATHTPSGTTDEGTVRVVTTTAPITDALPTSSLNPVYSLLPGALPLPHDSLKGCPVVADNPEIRLASPFSYVAQPVVGATPAGNIFMAQVMWDTTFDVTAIWRDYAVADQQTCAT